MGVEDIGVRAYTFYPDYLVTPLLSPYPDYPITPYTPTTPLSPSPHGELQRPQ